MHARCLDFGLLHAPGFDPVPQIAVDGDQTILGATRDPQQVKLLIGLGIEGGKIFLKVLGNAARAEGTDPGKLVEVV